MGNKHNAISRIKGTRSVYEVNRCDGGREGGRQERRRQGRREQGGRQGGRTQAQHNQLPCSWFDVKVMPVS
jgi:hypothetical protein